VGKRFALAIALAGCGRIGFATLGDAGGTGDSGDGGASGGLCTAHWCWQQPPARDDLSLRAIHGLSANDVWAVGDGGVIRVWDGTSWTFHSSPTSDVLDAVAVRGLNDVWVAARAGVLWHWDGTAWSSSTTPSGASVAAMWIDNMGRVWSAGDLGTISIDGSSEIGTPSRTSGMAIHGTSANDVWVAGFFNTPAHWNGSAWSEITIGDFPVAVWATSTGAWVVGNWVWQCSATTCAQATPGVQGRGIWAAADNDVWVVGDIVPYHWNGATWAPVVIPNNLVSNAVWGSSTSDVWVVGDGGLIMHYDGASWSVVANQGTSTLDWNAVWASAADDVWLGEFIAGEMYHYDGTTAVQDGPVVGDEIFGRTASDVWATGGANGVVHWDGSKWTDETVVVGTPAALALTPSDVIVAEGNPTGANAVYVKSSGTWQSAYSNASLWTGACGAASGEVIVVARFGQAAIRTAGVWAQHDTPSNRYLLGCTYAGTDAWAVGGDAVEHYAAGSWTDLTTFPTKHTLTGIAADASGGMYVTGNAGVLVRGDGTTWAEEATPTGADLQKITVGLDGTVYAIGPYNIILRRQ
jgi:hypothetical protein